MLIIKEGSKCVQNQEPMKRWEMPRVAMAKAELH